LYIKYKMKEIDSLDNNVYFLNVKMCKIEIVYFKRHPIETVINIYYLINHLIKNCILFN